MPDLQKINAAGKHLLELINDILDLSKIEAGQDGALPRDLRRRADSSRDVAAVIQPLARRTRNRLEVRCAPDVGAMHADQTKLRQALFNLLSNAGKFTEHGASSLAVSAGGGRGGDCDRLRGERHRHRDDARSSWGGSSRRSRQADASTTRELRRHRARPRDHPAALPA